MMANYIIWDFDGTLAHRPGRWSGALYEILQQYHPGHQIDIDDIRQQLRDGFPWHDYQSPHTEICGADEWWERLSLKFIGVYEQLGYPPAISMGLASKVRGIYTDLNHWHLYHDTVPVMETLSQRGWTHIILSNHVPELTAIVQHLGLERYIHQIFNSAETGYEKPHPMAFNLVQMHIDQVEQIWMIGDSPVADVAGAEAVGISAILARKDDEPLSQVLDILT